MSASSSVGKNAVMSSWIRFFKEAGIPAGDAAQYAIIFSDNRIQKDMLLDLNKEYLNDMGISIMGDVIAIIRHSKKVCSLEARSRVLQESVDSGESSTLSSLQTISKRTNSSNAKQTATTAPSKPITKGTKSVSKVTSASKSSVLTAAAAATASTASVGASNARNSPTAVAVRNSPTLGRRSTAASRLVGHYIGNDPDAHPMNKLTPKEKLSRDLALRLGPSVTRAKANQSPVEGGPVTSRLGGKRAKSDSYIDSVNPSDDDYTPDTSQLVRFKVIGLNSSPDSSTQSSVFSRLGDSLKRAAESTFTSEAELPYAGIFKSEPAKRAREHSPVATSSIKSRYDTEGILGKETLSGGIMGRLGAQLKTAPIKKKTMISTTKSPTKVKATPVGKLRMETEVTSSADSTTPRSGSKSIFDRLGQ